MIPIWAVRDGAVSHPDGGLGLPERALEGPSRDLRPFRITPRPRTRTGRASANSPLHQSDPHPAAPGPRASRRERARERRSAMLVFWSPRMRQMFMLFMGGGALDPATHPPSPPVRPVRAQLSARGGGLCNHRTGRHSHIGRRVEELSRVSGRGGLHNQC